MTIPIPVLDDRSFDQLVAEAKARIPVHTPEWTNLNDSDPGITIVELFAFLTENLLYRSNRIPEANRIKFLTMLGISLQPASPGNGLVAFSNDRGPLQPPLALPAGTALQAGQVPFLTQSAWTSCRSPPPLITRRRRPSTPRRRRGTSCCTRRSWIRAATSSASTSRWPSIPPPPASPTRWSTWAIRSTAPSTARCGWPSWPRKIPTSTTCAPPSPGRPCRSASTRRRRRRARY